jgi:hypothetical protein
MRTLRATLCATVLGVVLTACGSDGSSDAPDRSADSADPGSGTPRPAGCPVAERDADAVLTTWEADLDGDGASDEVTYLPDTADACSASLSTTVDGEVFTMSLAGLGLDPDTVRVLRLRGTERELLVGHGGFHPRGGFVLHVFGFDGDALEEVLADGAPVVGFVATDGGAAPATATCTDTGGLATWTATVAKPPGVLLAWDVRRTTYDLRGNVAESTGTDLVLEDAAEPILRERRPELFDPDGWFTNCTPTPTAAPTPSR